MREVAVWRGYVYAVNQIGRAMGPVLGGVIADNANWRWYGSSILRLSAPDVLMNIGLCYISFLSTLWVSSSSGRRCLSPCLLHERRATAVARNLGALNLGELTFSERLA